MWCHLITLFKRVFYQRDTSPQITGKNTKPSYASHRPGEWSLQESSKHRRGPTKATGHPESLGMHGTGDRHKQVLSLSMTHLPSQWPLQQALPSCSFSVVPTFLIFRGDFMKSGKMVRKPRMSTNLWQLSVPSGPIMAWSSTFRALLRETFFSLQTKGIL